MQVFLIAALTADGLIGQSRQQNSTTWTSPEDRQFFRNMSQKAGVIVMGATTYMTIGRPLPNRLNIVYAKEPKMIPPAPNLETTALPPRQLISKLAKAGYKSVAICGGASIYSLFLSSGVVNKLYLTIEPLMFGQGIRLIDKPVDIKLKLVKIHRLSKDTLVLEYNVL